ncbi:hypothetical protein M3Y99_00173500 [Aphelenchoides fujianensis]|nr:hypothetical protein M3Y99_00173500 [Aphelenchoides fujianensis]
MRTVCFVLIPALVQLMAAIVAKAELSGFPLLTKRSPKFDVKKDYFKAYGEMLAADEDFNTGFDTLAGIGLGKRAGGHLSTARSALLASIRQAIKRTRAADEKRTHVRLQQFRFLPPLYKPNSR